VLETVNVNVKPRLAGREVRCQAKVMKTYNGEKQLKTCGSLLAVIELNINGTGSATVHARCTKSNCKQMVHHTLSK